MSPLEESTTMRLSGFPRRGASLPVFVVAVALAWLMSAAALPAQSSRRSSDDARSGSIAGRVVDERTGAGVSDALVSLLGTTRTTLSARTGHFELGGIEPGSYRVQVRASGYQPAVASVTVVADSVARLSFRIATTAVRLDESVVLAQSEAVTRRTTGASIATIHTGALADAPVNTVSQLLRSRTPGLLSLPQGGKPGQGSRILLRGVRSLHGDVQPIVLVDGIRVDNSAENGLRSRLGQLYYMGGESWAGLDDFSVDDIDRIEVLSGPAAAALYGSEGADGVLQIFTKQGTGDRGRFNLNAEYGMTSTPRDWWGASPNRDWFYDNFVSGGRHYKESISMSGGVDGYNYYVGASARSEEGALPQSGSDGWSVRANMRAMPAQHTAINIYSGFTRREVDLPYDGNSTWGLTSNALIGGADGVAAKPEEILTYDVGLASSRFTGGVRLDNVLFTNFTQSLLVGADIFNSDDIDYNPYGTVVLEGGKKISYRRHVTSLNLDYRGSYRVALGDRVSAVTTVGVQGMKRDEAYTMAFGSQFAGPGLSTVETAGNTDGDENRSYDRMVGGYVQESFDLADLLFVSVGVRVDGFSSFGASNRYHAYPMASASYVASDQFHLPPAVSTLRLRVAYGSAGKPPAAFLTEESWQSVPAWDDEPGLITGHIGNPRLGPEVTREIEGGVDLGLFGDRLLVSATYYDQRTTDALFPVYAAPSLGFPEPQLLNAGETTNRGMELAATARIVEGPRFQWTLDGALYTNRNDVISIGTGNPLDVGGMQWIREGYPVAAFFDDAGAYIGPAFPTHTAHIGTSLHFGGGLRLGALVDHRGGHYLQSNTLLDLEQAGDPVANPIDDPSRFVLPADGWRLRELSLGYSLPVRWVGGVGAKGAILTLAGRNLWRSQKYAGFESEGSALALQPLLNQTSFTTPLPREVVLGVGVQF